LFVTCKGRTKVKQSGKSKGCAKVQTRIGKNHGDVAFALALRAKQAGGLGEQGDFVTCLMFYYV
jgi:hypothetical protein